MNWIKNELVGKNPHHADQSHGRGLLETSRYESTADKLGPIPSEQLKERRASQQHEHDLVDQSHGRGLLETSRYETTADKMGPIPSQQLMEQRGQSVSGTSGLGGSDITSSTGYDNTTSGLSGTTGTGAGAGIVGSSGYDTTTSGVTGVDTYGTTGTGVGSGTTGVSSSGYDTTTGTTGTTGLSSGYDTTTGTTGTTGLSSSGYDTTTGTTGSNATNIGTGTVSGTGDFVYHETAADVAARVLGAPPDSGVTGGSTTTGTGI